MKEQEQMKIEEEEDDNNLNVFDKFFKDKKKVAKRKIVEVE